MTGNQVGVQDGYRQVETDHDKTDNTIIVFQSLQGITLFTLWFKLLTSFEPHIQADTLIINLRQV